MSDNTQRTDPLDGLLLDALPHPAMLVGRDRVVLAANRIARHMGAAVGGECWRQFARSEFIPEADRAYLCEHGVAPPEGTHCAFCRQDEALARGEAVRTPNIHAFGRAWDVYWVPLNESTCLHYAVDVTEHERTEDLLRQERDRAQRYLDIAGVILVVIDADQRVSLLNRRGCEILGLTEEEAIGRNWFDGFVPAALREATRAAFVSLMAGDIEPVEHFENPVVTRSGEERLIAWHNTVLRDGQGRIVATLSSGEDITERRRAELRLKETVAELERSNADLEHFAHIVSHDLKEPLVTTSGFAQLLARRYEDALDHHARDYLDRIVSSVGRMEALINDVLELSRVSTSGREAQPVDCSEAFAQAVADLRQTIDAAGAEVTCRPLPTVTGNPSQLAQLYQNLIANAIKFRSQAPPAVHVAAVREGDAWHVTIRDNGIGIPQGSLERIFEMFGRLHRASEYPGTGIGLAICKRIVERHGGRIWATSEPGAGSTFHFTLPAMPE